MEKKILYIDMDGVTADFEAGVNALMPNMIWEQEMVDEVCEANPFVFETLPEIEGSVEAVKRLAELFEVYFLSTPMCNVPESYMGKRKWLHSKYGDWCEKRLILTHRKDLNKGEYLVDDRIKNGVENFDGHHIHFGTELFPDWNSVEKFLNDKI